MDLLNTRLVYSYFNFCDNSKFEVKEFKMKVN